MRSSMAVRIRQSRTCAALTQSQLAACLGVTRSAIAQWERECGGTHPSMARLTDISLATGVTFEWLATGRGAMRDASAIDAPPTAHACTEDALEVRCLKAMRKLPEQKRASISLLLAQLAL